MIIGTTAQWPTILALGFLDRKIVDACVPCAHQTVLVELPVLVAIGPEPVPGIVVPFVREPNGDTISVEGPKLFNQAVIELLRPLALEERDDLRSSVHELRPISPV